MSTSEEDLPTYQNVSGGASDARMGLLMESVWALGGDYVVKEATGAQTPVYLVKNKYLGMGGRVSVTDLRGSTLAHAKKLAIEQDHNDVDDADTESSASKSASGAKPKIGKPVYTLCKANLFGVHKTVYEAREEGTKKVLWKAKSTPFFDLGSSLEVLDPDDRLLYKMNKHEQGLRRNCNIINAEGRCVATMVKIRDGDQPSTSAAGSSTSSTLTGGSGYSIKYEPDAKIDVSLLASICALRINHVQGLTA